MIMNTQLEIKEENIIIRSKILSIEEQLKLVPGAMVGDCFPLKHTFVPGMYIREITMPAGALLTSKIHKMEHPYFILRGDVSVLTEKGVVRLKTGFSGITPAGTKRLLYCHEETVWVTVHRTDSTDLKLIEEEVIAKNFDEFYNVLEVTDFVKELNNAEDNLLSEVVMEKSNL
jgi:quercetin dioxygenase-like cupin family protein